MLLFRLLVADQKHVYSDFNSKLIIKIHLRTIFEDDLVAKAILLHVISFCSQSVGDETVGVERILLICVIITNTMLAMLKTLTPAHD